MQRKYLIGLTILLGVCLCATVIAIGALAIPETREVIQLYARGASPTRDATQAIAKGTPTRREIITPPPIVLESATPNILPPLAATPLTEISFETFNALARATFLPRDLFQIAPRLKKISSPLILPTPIARARQVGDKDNFFIVLSAFGGKYRAASATLQLISPHAYFWIEDGQRFDKTALQIAADFFEQNIYPTNHKYFGSERIPGPDGDAHIHIFNGKLDNNTGGYFSSSDTYPLSISQYSNVRHIIYMNLPAVQPGRPEYNADLAHEVQHLIHNNQAEQKAGWIDEGMGDLAVRLNGFPTGSANAYAENPDTQLNTWADEPRANFAHYGGSYLFFNYLQGRFGPEVIRDVILAPCEGICGVQSALNKRANGLQFDDAFADWAATNFLNNPAIENGRYAYSNEKDFKITRETSIARYPSQLAVTMHEYGANYFALDPQARDVTIYFTGTTTAKLLPINARSGKWMWYSNRADLADMNLTREVDLARVTKATLKFWTWYSIEKDFDYAYVQVS
ncbi:MAG: immune inhibitor A, partial [Chloroflexi bacterium]|nr:immune inhibitor A [Chloroflexota bacterium]